MYKVFVWTVAVIGALGLSACFKKDTCPAIEYTNPTAAELESLAQFVAELDEDAVFDPRGFYYRIVKEGTANKPGICSDIFSNWECTNGDNVIYYQSGTDNLRRVFDLSHQPYVWRMAFPMVGMGGEIIVYAPPSLQKGYNLTKAAMHIESTASKDANVVYKLSLIRYN
ncbi:MAG TPA: hypothetical protein VKZ76_05150 [Edaphocola sp.]|nr:hypothetical protein [Edaphocola sp.]